MTANIMVMLKRLPIAERQHDIGDGKDKTRRANAEHQRGHLIDWMNEQGLSDQLVRIDAPTRVNLLHIEGTSALASALQGAPDVLCVALVDDFQVTLLGA